MRLRPVLLAATLLGASAAPLLAQAALRAAPSSRATASVTLAYPRDSTPAGARPATILVNYGQPHLRGRALHTDSLVPYGQPWRTGANEATVLVTGVDLTIGGQPVSKGTYQVWTLPTREGWTLILQRDTSGVVPPMLNRYVPANDAARIPLRAQALPVTVESLTFWLVPTPGAAPARGELRFAWGTTLLTTEWVVR
ncbi:MAG TPA: DUF2911 domain-containing protein [Gemmatimonadaceae bacterium]|nr:DUF2911 domain-containing protein [Gemmatimonadaceae bacterium]